MFRWRCALLGLLVMWPVPLRADITGGAQDARALIGEGVVLRKRGDDLRALAAFERAFALDPSPEALTQRALAEQALGRWLDAHEHLQTALQSEDDAWIVDHRATLETALREIASRLGSLEVICNVSNAEVRLDGRVLGRTPLAGPVRAVAGQGVLQVSADGYFEISRQVYVDALGLSRVDVTLTRTPVHDAPPRAPVAAPLQAPRRESPSQPSDVLLYTSLGLAALGTVVGVTGYVMREVNVELYNDDSRCNVRVGIRRSEECPDEASAWRRGEVLAIGGASAAGVFGAAAVYFWLSRPARDKKPSVACSFEVSSVSCAGQF